MSFDPIFPTTKGVLRKLGGDKISGKVLTFSFEDFSEEDAVFLGDGYIKVTDEVVDLTTAKMAEINTGSEVFVITEFTVETIAEGSLRMTNLLDGANPVAICVHETVGEYQKGTYLPAAPNVRLEFAETIHPIDPKYLPADTIDLDAYGLDIATLVMSGGGKQDFGTADNNLSAQFAAELMSKKPKYAKISLGTLEGRCTVSTLTDTIMGLFLTTTVNGTEVFSTKIVIVANPNAITVIADVG